MKTFLEYLQTKIGLGTYFTNDQHAYQFNYEVKKYGLSAFEKLPIETQTELINSYHFVYLRQPV